MKDFNSLIVQIIREAFGQKDGFIPLHVPHFGKREKELLNECIDSTFVSSVGTFVTKFEDQVAAYTGATKAIAVTNGTAALHLALDLAGVREGELVITQPLSFIATANSIAYIGADPLFVDVDTKTLGLSPGKLEEFLHEKTELRTDGLCYHKSSGKRIAACVPMHTYGHPVEIDRIVELCNSNAIPVVEDSAEALGSFYKEQHVGTFGQLGIFSFNGNKIITCGGGAMVVTNNTELAAHGKHLSTQAKVPHPWEFAHDQIGYNYRLPNLNAALGFAQMEKLDQYKENKAQLANYYKNKFQGLPVKFFEGLADSSPNHWLNAILFENTNERDAFLKYSNVNEIMTRPAWELTPTMPMFKYCICEDISNAEQIHATLVNIPSSVRV